MLLPAEGDLIRLFGVELGVLLLRHLARHDAGSPPPARRRRTVREARDSCRTKHGRARELAELNRHVDEGRQRRDLQGGSQLLGDRVGASAGGRSRCGRARSRRSRPIAGTRDVLGRSRRLGRTVLWGDAAAEVRVAGLQVSVRIRGPVGAALDDTGEGPRGDAALALDDLVRERRSASRTQRHRPVACRLRAVVDPLAPGEVLEVPVLAHRDERDLREVGGLPLALAIRALLPPLCDQLQLVSRLQRQQKCQSGNRRNGTVRLRFGMRSARAQRSGKSGGSRKWLTRSSRSRRHSSTRNSPRSRSRESSSPSPLVPVVEAGGEHRGAVRRGDHRPDAERRDEVARAGPGR